MAGTVRSPSHCTAFGFNHRPLIVESGHRRLREKLSTRNLGAGAAAALPIFWFAKSKTRDGFFKEFR
jgi:hypothetical protein